MKNLSLNDVRGMCKYLNGEQSSITFDENFCINSYVRDDKTLYEEMRCQAGSFIVRCHPDFLKDYLDVFSAKEKDGQTIVILADPFYGKLHLQENGSISYLCFTFSTPKRDVCIVEVIKNTATFMTIFGADSGHVTVFIPMVVSVPKVVLSTYPHHEEFGTIGIAFAYNRYP